MVIAVWNVVTGSYIYSYIYKEYTPPLWINKTIAEIYNTGMCRCLLYRWLSLAVYFVPGGILVAVLQWALGTKMADTYILYYNYLRIRNFFLIFA